MEYDFVNRVSETDDLVLDSKDLLDKNVQTKFRKKEILLPN